MTDRIVNISMCVTCPHFVDDDEGKDCLYCEKHFDDSFEGNSIPDWCELPKADTIGHNSRHESDELPEWVVNKLNDSIVDCGLLEAELKDDNDIEEAVRVGRRANTLRWVLSLRKPEDK